eukprot:TRINITY_DN2114_c0_g1_i2.p1 TRINITY_DN2114_c0_g1~~TRINITY_DN2114_c0_g1_i2.p1  ORF type:complete len:148 (-),score=12.88 TRINITY_DN2114_c0_g1_i2:37-480(-)
MGMNIPNHHIFCPYLRSIYNPSIPPYINQFSTGLNPPIGYEPKEETKGEAKHDQEAENKFTKLLHSSPCNSQPQNSTIPKEESKDDCAVKPVVKERNEALKSLKGEKTSVEVSSLEKKIEGSDAFDFFNGGNISVSNYLIVFTKFTC